MSSASARIGAEPAADSGTDCRLPENPHYKRTRIDPGSGRPPHYQVIKLRTTKERHQRVLPVWQVQLTQVRRRTVRRRTEARWISSRRLSAWRSWREFSSRSSSATWCFNHMTFNVEEKHAVAGGIAAAGLPLAMNIANVPIEDGIVSLADAVFEGDAGSAAFVTGLGMTVIGLGLIGAAVYTSLDDWLGILAAGLGAGFLALGAQAFDVARGN